MNYVQQESFPVRHLLTYAFTSSHAGYGDRSGMVTAQVITEHSIVITITDGTVQSAVIDGTWDEMAGLSSALNNPFHTNPRCAKRRPGRSGKRTPAGCIYGRRPMRK